MAFQRLALPPRGPSERGLFITLRPKARVHIPAALASEIGAEDQSIFEVLVDPEQHRVRFVLVPEGQATPEHLRANRVGTNKDGEPILVLISAALFKELNLKEQTRRCYVDVGTYANHPCFEFTYPAARRAK